MSSNPNAGILARHIMAENAHDLAATLATLHSDCVFTDHATGQRWHGHAGASAHYKDHWAAFDVEVVRAEGQISLWSGEDTYVAQAVWRGTHIGEFMGIAPTGRHFEHPFTVFVRFRDGLMESEEFFYDLASLMATLGEQRLPELAQLPHRTTA